MKLESLLSPMKKSILDSRYNMYWKISTFHYSIIGLFFTLEI